MLLINNVHVKNLSEYVRNSDKNLGASELVFSERETAKRKYGFSLNPF
jgi:hypothetical protein